MAHLIFLVNYHIIEYLVAHYSQFLKLSINLVMLPPKILYNLYFGFLGTVYRSTRRNGIIGEGTLLLVGTVLMLWPLCMPFIIKENTYRLVLWIVSIIGSGILIILGKKCLDKEVNKNMST